MPMTRIDADMRSWGSHNMWLDPAKNLRVRPGLRRMWTVDSGRDVVGGFSVFNYHTDESWHYIFDVDRQASATSNQVDCRLKVYDEDWIEIQELALYADRIPRDITHAIIGEGGFIAISSPDFPTLRGLVGGGVRVAEKVAGDILTPVDVPRGLCCRWANRLVICEDNLMYVSDPVAGTGGDPFTFVAPNILDRMGKIIGVHSTQDDLLVVVTTRGVWGFPGEAAAEADIADSGARWMHIQDYEGTTYRSSCVSRGKVYGLTKNGFRRLDIREPSEVDINDPVVSLQHEERVWSSDWRSSDIFGSDHGPMVNSEWADHWLMSDVDVGFKSWWGTAGYSDPNNVVGTLRRPNGEELILTSRGAYLATGNFEGDYNMDSAGSEQTVKGVLLGRIDLPPAGSHVIRCVYIMTDIGGGSNLLTASLHDQTISLSPINNHSGLVVGTDVWDDADKPQREPELRSHAFDFARRTDDLALEIVVSRPLTRVGNVVEIEMVVDDRGEDS